MDAVTIIGIAAGILTTGSFLPQILKIAATKRTQDLSLIMYIVLCVGVALWVAYGILSNSLPVIIANSVVFALCIYIIIMKLRCG